MDNIDNIMQLCRLCLVKDQVNVPIFGGTNDIEEISSKISSCLPVKVSPDDSLPKKICDDCSYKLDLLYVFRNTSINSEKQLYQWLEQAGISKTTSGTISTTQSLTTPILATDSTIPSVPISTLDTVINDTITKSEISVKQEKTESTAGSELSAETQEYLLQQQKLPYQENFGDFNTTGTNSATAETEEPARKKPRRAAASKPPIKDNESDPDVPPTKAEDDSDEDIDDAGDGGGMDDDDDEEEEEEDDGLDHPEFVDVPSTSAEEQPGPSGVNKDPIAAPRSEHFIIVLKKTNPVEIFKCNSCSRIYQSKLQLQKHKRLHRERLYACPHCPKKWRFPFEVKKHIHAVHLPRKSHICDVCGKVFRTLGGLDDHMEGHRGIFNYTCNECGAKFKRPYTLQNHVKVEHEGLRFTCIKCKKVFRTEQAYKIHIKTHEPDYIKETYTCDVCDKVLTHKRSFYYHMKSHTGSNDHNMCDICGLRVTTKTSLKNHIKTHSGVKEEICDTCGKAYRNKKSLFIHRRIHTNEKPFTCSLCNKAFSQKGTLNVHMRYHTGERPYKCDICSKGFVTGTLLKRHKCLNKMSRKESRKQ